MRQIVVPQQRGRPRSRLRQLAGDRGYDTQRIRQWLQHRSVIPPRHRRRMRKAGCPVGYDPRAYCTRTVVEYTIRWLKECHSVAMRFEKLVLN